MEELDYPTLRLSRSLGITWANIEAARELARLTLAQLKDEFRDFDSEDTSIVVLGSLGRKEFTPGSDIDWNLLVDGIADPNHQELLLNAQERIRKVAKAPGQEGTFGKLVSSHDLIHRIGGEDDTNANLTRRLLLVLESAAVGRAVAQERVVKNILKRYLLEDRSFWKGTSEGHHIPHFLLNDFARLWRTMAIDFAYKLRARGGKGWALRNIKLRMSRKLLYVAGLLGCFRCHIDFFDDEGWRDAIFRDESLRTEVFEMVSTVFSDTPLDILATFLDGHEHLSGTALRLFGAYDEFLGILLDPDRRQLLENLKESESGADATYQQARDISHRFRDALLELFFDDKTELAKLTRLYGVF
jgi:predicted nucleotidyltransferase